MSAPEVFSVNLHHLDPTATQAGRAFPDVTRTKISVAELRAMLDALEALAPTCDYTIAPEIRIEGTLGRFLVQVRHGQVRVRSWSVKADSALTAAQIVALVTGTEAPPEEPVTTSLVEQRALTGKPPRRLAAILLVAGIVCANAITVWMVLKPKRHLPDIILPKYHLIDAEYGRRVLNDFAGSYETGGNDGDRSLTIAKDGQLKWVQFGPARSVVEAYDLTAQPASSREKPVLVTSNGGMIEMKDAISVVYFGDTYRRKSP